MRNNLLEDTFADVAKDDLVRRISDETFAFSSLVRELRLDPKRDFRHADLVGVDFSGADLSSFDFTGADLRGSFGVGVRIDGAVLHDAELSGSLFEYANHRRKYFADRPEAAKVLRSLAKDHWTRSTNWVADNVHKKRSPEAVEISKALFLETDDMVLKNNILFFLGPSFEDRASYLAFLLATLNAHGGDWKIRASVINVLGSVFREHRVAFDVLEREVPLSEGMAQQRILIALARSRHNQTAFAEMRDFVKASTIPPNRRAYVRASIQSRAPRFWPLLADETFARKLDFGAILLEQDVWEGARKALLAEWQAKIGLNVSAALADMTHQDVHKRVILIQSLLQDLDEAGFEITVTPQPELR